VREGRWEGKERKGEEKIERGMAAELWKKEKLPSGAEGDGRPCVLHNKSLRQVESGRV